MGYRSNCRFVARPTSKQRSSVSFGAAAVFPRSQLVTSGPTQEVLILPTNLLCLVKETRPLGVKTTEVVLDVCEIVREFRPNDFSIFTCHAWIGWNEWSDRRETGLRTRCDYAECVQSQQLRPEPTYRSYTSQTQPFVAIRQQALACMCEQYIAISAVLYLAVNNILS